MPCRGLCRRQSIFGLVEGGGDHTVFLQAVWGDRGGFLVVFEHVHDVFCVSSFILVLCWEHDVVARIVATAWYIGAVRVTSILSENPGVFGEDCRVWVLLLPFSPRGLYDSELVEAFSSSVTGDTGAFDLWEVRVCRSVVHDEVTVH